jgi:phage protein D
MIDTKIQESFKNKSASDIAIAIAKSHNMTANVVATHDMAGAYYDRDHDQLNDSHFSKTTTEWDLLTYLAQQQDPSYDCYVTGTTLNFVPSQPPNSNPWTIYLGPPEIQGFGYVKFPESNVNDLRLDRSLTLAKDVQVTAESYDPDSGKKIRVVVKSHNTASPGKADPRGTPTQNYILRLHGVNGDTALKRAKQMAEDITKHERLISWSEPGDMNLSPRNLVNVTGTDSSWDQIYYIDSIDRSITVDGGFTMNVRAKNHSTITQTVE